MSKIERPLKLVVNNGPTKKKKENPKKQFSKGNCRDFRREFRSPRGKEEFLYDDIV
ncbi:hypothetical protein [Syntrophomonas palmitatica]|uniref:hypothetical protein n=1 Tax=Syntrophomonas palmitatica TaxID=402877 RepID=UPI000A675E2A|nr:hypothetical protein [Syntrophomonas palmitatica]